MLAQMLFLLIAINMCGVFALKNSDQRQGSNFTEQIGNKEREGRQYGAGYGPGFGDYGLSSFGGPIEAVIIGLLIVAGFAVVGIPFFLIFLTLFNGGGILGQGGIGGFGTNLIPTSTTTVGGRKKRESNSLLPEANPLLQQKLFKIFEDFISTPDKIKLIEKLLDSMVGRN